jgi:hypothetical protein
MQLAERTIDAWDAHAQRHAARPDLVVCLTTLPSRIDYLQATLASLCAQTLRPREIRLHVPRFSKREQRACEVPQWLSRMKSVRVIQHEDLGPATKLLPALCDEPPDTQIVVVDDDRIYPRELLQTLSNASTAQPDFAHCAAGWVVPDDLTDRPTTLASNLKLTPPTPITATRIAAPARVDVLQGRAGYLVRPRFFELSSVLDYASAPEGAFFVDDVWISAHCRAPKQVLPMSRFCFAPWRGRVVHSRSAVSLHNSGGGRAELRNNTLLIRHFAQRWMNAERSA